MAQFRVRAIHNNRHFIVQIKRWYGWSSGHNTTDFFDTRYWEKDKALEAIDLFVHRHTEYDPWRVRRRV